MEFDFERHPCVSELRATQQCPSRSADLGVHSQTHLLPESCDNLFDGRCITVAGGGETTSRRGGQLGKDKSSTGTADRLP